MGQVSVTRLDDLQGLTRLRELFAADNPGFELDVVTVEGESALRSMQGGMRVYWIYQGAGEVFVPKGYRTQEGDGRHLPAEYHPDTINPDFACKLTELRQGLSSLSAAAIVPARAILGRWQGDAFVGDFAGDLWKLDHLPRPWSASESINALLGSLFESYREHGHSTKQFGSFEPVMQGDQLITSADDELRVRGRFCCLAIENTARHTSHVSAIRRLRYLADTAGGCNPDFDPFRRLPLTWYYNYPGELGDGLNWVNSHVVNIPRETSPSHFHPPRPIGAAGGAAQREMYLVLDPAAYRLNTWGRQAGLLAFPDLRNLHSYQQYRLEPGMFIYIPPGTGHRGLDVFVNVLTIPGFKPNNEYYIDRDIRDAASGNVPFNEALVESKNYTRLEDLLGPE
jgi:hypothetical protein